MWSLILLINPSAQSISALSPQSGVTSIKTPDLPFLTKLLAQISLTQLLLITGFISLAIIIFLIIRLHDLSKLTAVVGIALMTAAVPLSVLIMNSQTRVQSHASLSTVPKNILLTQVTATGFSVLWDTDQPGVGVLRYRPAINAPELNQVISEVEARDIYKHLIKVVNLKPNSDYYLEILSGGIWYDQGGVPLHVKTLGN